VPSTFPTIELPVRLLRPLSKGSFYTAGVVANLSADPPTVICPFGPSNTFSPGPGSQTLPRAYSFLVPSTFLTLVVFARTGSSVPVFPAFPLCVPLCCIPQFAIWRYCLLVSLRVHMSNRPPAALAWVRANPLRSRIWSVCRDDPPPPLPFGDVCPRIHRHLGSISVTFTPKGGGFFSFSDLCSPENGPSFLFPLLSTQRPFLICRHPRYS